MSRIINNFKKKEIRKCLRKNQTPQEVKLWTLLRNNNLGYKWKRQVSIGKYIADFYCAKKLLVIEVDGSQHLDNEEYDQERERVFSDLGIRTIRFWNNEINTNIEGVINKITSELEMRPHPGLQASRPLLSWKGEGEKDSNRKLR